MRELSSTLASTTISPPPLSSRFDASSSAPSPITSSPPSPPATPVPIVAAAAPLAAVAPAPAREEEEGEMTYEEAVKRREANELEQAKLMCSLENKEACVMCSVSSFPLLLRR